MGQSRWKETRGRVKGDTELAVTYVTAGRKIHGEEKKVRDGALRCPQ